MNLARGAMVVLLAMAAGCRAEYTALYSIPGSDLIVGVELKQINPPLAEYNRTLLVGPPGGPLESVELFPDTGGYALVNLYQTDSSTFLVNTVGNSVYRLKARSPSITTVVMAIPENQRVPKATPFVGAFDFDQSHSWRFIEATERHELEIGKLHNVQ